MMNSKFRRIRTLAAALTVLSSVLLQNTLLMHTAVAEDTNTVNVTYLAEQVTVGGCTIPQITAEKRAIPDTEGLKMTRDMRLGWNLGNTLDAIDDSGYISNELDLETYWNGGYKTTQEMIDTVKKAGFNTVRVPVSWHNHVDGDLNISKKWMDRVQQVVDYAVKDDMYVILNVHHDNDLKTMYPDSAHYEQSSKYMTRMWEQIADRFKDYNDKLIFETMNEPRMTGNTYEWWLNMADQSCIDAVNTINKLNQDCLDTIRKSGGNNATRYVSVPGYDCSIDGATNSYFKLPNDSAQNRLIVAVHAYVPYGFALAETSDAQSTDKFDYKKDTADIDKVLDAIYDTFISKGIPVYIGEFGAREKNGNTQVRVDWAAYYVANASARGIPCCWWDDISFMLLDRAETTWKRPEIVTALNTYAMGEYTADLKPSDDTPTEIKEGRITVDAETGNYNISIPAASKKIWLKVELSDAAAGGVSGCIANGFMKDNVYYWAMVPWKAKSTGEVVIDIDRDFGTLSYKVGEESLTSEDETLIAEAKEYLKSLKEFQGQIWWVGDASYNTIDNSNAKITGAYIKTAADAQPEETTASTSQPAETTTTSSQPAETTVSASQPAETTVSASQPAETTGSASQPAETTTSESQPAETTNAASQPETAALPGDANDDGSVTVSDAVLLARVAAEDASAKITASGKANGDVNHSGKIEADDVTVILQFLAGLVDTL